MTKRYCFLILILISVITLFFVGLTRSFLFNKETNKNGDLREAKLTVVGDFLFEEPYYNSIRLGDSPDAYFEKVKNYFSNDDLSIGNMEVVIGNENLEVSGTGYNFCAPSSIGDLVSSLSLEVLGTANNHTYDRGDAGILSTLNYFKEKSNIATVGTTLLPEPYIIKEIKGIKFGFLAYTYGTNQKVPLEKRKNISLYKDPDTKEIQYAKIEEEVKALKAKADVIVVMMHWGREFTYEENEEQRTLATFLNSLGVDIVVGSHSHSIEPIKWVGDKKKTLVFYSLGNFTSADEDIERTGEEFDNAYQFGLLAQLKVKKKDNDILIEDIKTEPIINYYDSSFRHFELVPYSLYNQEYEQSHYRYHNNFNRDFIKRVYETVIAAEFR